jgi:hypothetical protein
MLDIAGIVAQLLGPNLVQVLLVVGILRVVIKPLMSIARAVVTLTAGDADDKALDKVEASSIYKGVTYVLDWFTSIKIGPQAK